jgi:type VI secretion system secreted protein VgrG
MATITQTNRAIQVKTPFKDNALLVERMQLIDQLSRPFELQLHLVSEDGKLNPDTILGKDVTVTIPPMKGGKRHFHGFVTEFSQVGYSRRLHQYRATVSPWLWFLTRTSDCRIFQGKSVPDIFEEVAKGHGFTDYKLKLKGSFEPFEYCVQYRETDFNFISRLLEQEGIFYYFTHKEGSHLMVLSNDANDAEAISGYGEVPFFPPSAPEAQRERDHLTSWTFSKVVRPGAYVTTEYDFTQPKTRLLQTATISRSHAKSGFEIFDAPAEIPKMTTGETARIARIRVQELQSDHMVARGSGNAAGLATGARFKLTKYPRDDLNIEYLVTSVALTATSDPHVSGGSDGELEFDVQVEAVDVKTPWRPPRLTPRPSVQGPQTAIVVGPSGEEIYTDKYGRVKVQFHWDRHGKEDENSSCWLSVSQPWASKNWGAINIPRIGDEVVVAFLEGDPDRPFVIGRMYNGTHMPPHELPAKKTQTIFMSRSSRGGAVENCNEIRFEDEKGKEELYIHAEKDQLIEVENDEKHEVGHDRKKNVANDETTTIGNNRTETVSNNESITIQKNRTESVGEKESISIGKDQSLTVSGNRVVTVDKDQTTTVTGDRKETVSKGETVQIAKDRKHQVDGNDMLKVGKELLIDAGDSITIKTGSATITMKKDGTITIKGKDITLDGSGKINIKAGGDVIVKGSKVTQN